MSNVTVATGVLFDWGTSAVLTIVISLLLVLPTQTRTQSNVVALEKYRWALPERPLNCETNLQHLEALKVMVANQSNRDGILIMLARLGDGERRRDLNRRRLDNVRDGLTNTLGIDERRIIVGQGQRVRGYGRVEFYLEGRMVGVLPVNRNSAIIKCKF